MIMLAGKAVGDLSPNPRRAAGLGLVPEERLGRGAVPGLSLTANLLLSHQKAPYVKRGMIDFGFTRRAAASIIERFKVKAAGPDAPAKSLSGGNLQKFIVGRELDRNPTVMVVNQPTWGVDAGASAHIRQALIELARSGSAVLVISQDLDELFEISDAIAVMHNGELSKPIPIAEATFERIGLLMGGAEPGHAEHSLETA